MKTPNLIKVMGLALIILWLALKILTWFFHSSFTVIVIKAAQDGEIGFYCGAGFLGLIMLISVLTIAMIYRRGYQAIFWISEAGVKAGTMPKQRRTNQAVRNALYLAGAISGKIGPLAAAQVSQASETAFITWSNLQKIEPNPDKRTIKLINSWRTVILVYCTPENYERVLIMIEDHCHISSAR